MKNYSGFPHLWGNLLVAIDYETTGSQPGYHEIIQIAIVPLTVDLEPHPDLRPFYHNIAPQYPERAQLAATRTHGLNLAELQLTAPSSDKVADLLVEWFEDIALGQDKKMALLAHNCTFEIAFGKQWLGEDLWGHLFHFIPRDGMTLATGIRDRAYLKGNPLPFKRVGLKHLCHYFKIVNENPHDALADCIAEAAVYKELLRHEGMI